MYMCMAHMQTGVKYQRGYQCLLYARVCTMKGCFKAGNLHIHRLDILHPDCVVLVDVQCHLVVTRGAPPHCVCKTAMSTRRSKVRHAKDAVLDSCSSNAHQMLQTPIPIKCFKCGLSVCCIQILYCIQCQRFYSTLLTHCFAVLLGVQL